MVQRAMGETPARFTTISGRAKKKQRIQAIIPFYIMQNINKITNFAFG